LRRIDDGKVIGGVAGGIARWLDIDPVLVRVLAVVLAMFGGSGLVLYLIGWLFLPSDSSPESPAQSVLGKSKFVLVLAAAALVVLVLNVMGGMFTGGLPILGTVRLGLLAAGPFVMLVVLGLLLLGVLWLLRGGRAPQPADTAASMSTRLAAAPMEPAKQPRERSFLGVLTVSTVLIVVGVLLTLRLSGAAHLSAVVILAAALGVVGCGLLVGAFVGRARGLIALGLLLIVALVPTTVINNMHLPFHRNANETLVPASAAQLPASYELGAGRVTLNLRQLRNDSTPHSMTVRLGVGTVRIVLPRTLVVVVAAQANVGVIRTSWTPWEISGTSVARTYSLGTATPQRQPVTLHVQVGAGQVEVVRP